MIKLQAQPGCTGPQPGQGKENSSSLEETLQQPQERLIPEGSSVTAFRVVLE